MVTVFLKHPTSSVDLLKEFEQLPAANIADTMNRIAVLGNGIKRISSPKKPIMAGFAITVKVRAGDNLMLHAALDMAGENDVIVVSNEGDRSRALMGEIMVAYAHCMKKSPVSCWTGLSAISMRCRFSIFRCSLPALTPQARLNKVQGR